MRSRLRAASAVIVLIVSVAVAALWVRSYESTDIIGFNIARKGVCILVMRGTVWCAAGNPGPNTGWLHQSLPADQQIDIPDSHSFACVGWSRGQGWFPLGLPLWSLTAIAAYAAHRLRRRRPIPAGFPVAGPIPSEPTAAAAPADQQRPA